VSVDDVLLLVEEILFSVTTMGGRSRIREVNEFSRSQRGMSRCTVAAAFILLLVAIVEGKRGRLTKHKADFVPSTYNLCVGSCRGLSTPMSPASYRANLRKYGPACTGAYCIEGKGMNGWGTDRHRLDYEVEHIIDRNGEEYNACSECKDVPGNYIMAYGLWNAEMGAIGMKSYTAMVEEKTRIYGQSIMNSARAAIEECCRARDVIGERLAYTPSQKLLDWDTDDDPSDDFEFYGPDAVTVECNCSDRDSTCLLCDFFHVFEDVIDAYQSDSADEKSLKTAFIILGTIIAVTLVIIGATTAYIHRARIMRSLRPVGDDQATSTFLATHFGPKKLIEGIDAIPMTRPTESESMGREVPTAVAVS